MKTKIATYFAVCATLFFSACSTNPLTVSLSELGTATKSDIGSRGMRLIRSINVTGLGATEVVGSYTFDPDPNFFSIPVPWGTTNIPDTLFPRFIPGCTTIVAETKFPDASHDDVIAVRDNLFKLNEIQLQKVTYEMQLAVLQEIKSSSASSSVSAASSPSTTTLSELDKKELDQARKITGLADIENIETEIKSLGVLISALDKQIAESKNALDKSLNTASIVVTNWSRTERIQANTNAADGGATASMQQSKQMTGYLVLGSPRVASLIIGNDLLARATNQKNGTDGDLSNLEHQSDLYITQHTLAAKELAWTESRSGSFEARVQVQIDKVISALSQLPTKVGNNIKAKLDVLKVNAGFGFASAYSASSTGTLGKATSAAYRFSFHADYPNALLTEMSRANKYRNVYTSRVTLARLVDKHKETNPRVGEACHNTELKNDLSYFEENLLDTGMGVDLSSELVSTQVRIPVQRKKVSELIASLPKNNDVDKARHIVEGVLEAASQSATDALIQCLPIVKSAESTLISARSGFISQVDDGGRSTYKKALETASGDAAKTSQKVSEIETKALQWLKKLVEEAKKDDTLKNNFEETHFKESLDKLLINNKLENIDNCTD